MENLANRNRGLHDLVGEDIEEEEELPSPPWSRASTPRFSRDISTTINNESEQTLYITVSKKFKENKLNVTSALKLLPSAKKIFLVHIYCPPMISLFPASQMTNQQIEAHNLKEREKLNKSLEEYMHIFRPPKLQAEKLVIVKDDVAKGLVDLISQLGIRRLVMGAAADKHYSKNMIMPRSMKACVVQKEAHPSCKIWFVCKGNLISIRESSLDRHVIDSPIASTSITISPDVNESPEASPGTVSSNVPCMENPSTMTLTLAGSSCLKSLVTGRGAHGLFKNKSKHAGTGDDETASNVGPDPVPVDGVSELGSQMPQDDSLIARSTYDFENDPLMIYPPQDSEEDPHISSAHDQEEGSEMYELFDKLQQALMEAQRSKREVYEESQKCNRVENEALLARRNAKGWELRYTKEMRLRKETETMLEREKLELENLRRQQKEISEELQRAHQQKLAMEIQIKDTKMECTREIELLAKDFQEKVSSLQNDRDSIQVERNELQEKWSNVTQEVEELQETLSEVLGNSHEVLNFSEFSYSELDQATRGFDSSLSIGKGGYGSVYKGFLRHTMVAIKVLNPNSLQGRSEFYQEINILSKARHPNLVTLMGVCSDVYALVYEFLPNGSLDERLSCVSNSQPLSWKVRTRICAEICSALIFLHSSKPQSVVHGDLKPSNILLDSNLTSKLSDFGISRLLVQSATTDTLYHMTDPKGTLFYMDPHFTSTGVLTPQSDVYSFGIIILQLLTGKPPVGILKFVCDALEVGALQTILDPSAGIWPFLQAQQLAKLAVRCCELNRKNRPDLEEVWMAIEPMKNVSVGSSSLSYIPSYFICPMFKEIMRDPHVAADGFTYEAEAIKGWLEGGQETSPMTNLKLENKQLTPNRALCAAIQEWSRQHDL